MNNELMFSSKEQTWETPQDFYDRLYEKYDFNLDLAASVENTKCYTWYSEEMDSLKQEWHNQPGWCWLNPPYNKCKEFMKKCYEEMQKGARIVALVPARTDTRWFHDYVYNKEGVSYEFIKGRLKFGNQKNSAPFPSMLVIFNKEAWTR